MVVQCDQCKREFSSQTSLNRHIKTVHNIMTPSNIVSYDFNQHNSKCLECLRSFKQISDLREHLFHVHNFQILTEVLIFEDFQGFDSWLSSLSAKENVQYIRVRGKKKTRDGVVTYYYNCNRTFIPRKQKITPQDGNRKRMEKSQGSCKLNYACTSQIKVVEKDGKIFVTYYKSHYKHKNEVQHLRISKKDRHDIQQKLLAGIPISRILDQNRESITGDEIRRIHLLSRKDVNNIRKSLNVTKFEQYTQNENDSISLDSFVEEQARLDENCVLYYNKYGESYDLLGEDDFCLILMSESQKYLLERFGEQIIAIDSTQVYDNDNTNDDDDDGVNDDENINNFELTSIIIIDEFGEPIPVATMCTNRTDTFICEMFFNKIKEKLQKTIKPRIFLSDIVQLFLNAWVTVMGEPQQFFFYDWYVDKAWKKSLEKVPDLDKRQWIYQTLKYLQQYPNNDEFVQVFEDALNIFQEDSGAEEWVNYFQNTFSGNYQYWATCYRKCFDINLDINLDDFHKIINNVYTNNFNIGKCLINILTFVNNKIAQRTRKSIIQRKNDFLQDIQARHLTAETSKEIIEVVKGDRVFRIKNKKGSYYEVKKIASSACCGLKCQFCKICVHSFTCSCSDFCARNTICKHIHLIVLKNYAKIEYDETNENTDNDEDEKKHDDLDGNDCDPNHIDSDSEALMFFEKFEYTNGDKEQYHIREMISVKIDEILQKAANQDNETNLIECYEYLERASLCLDNDNETTLINDENIVQNDDEEIVEEEEEEGAGVVGVEQEFTVVEKQEQQDEQITAIVFEDDTNENQNITEDISNDSRNDHSYL